MTARIEGTGLVALVGLMLLSPGVAGVAYVWGRSLLAITDGRRPLGLAAPLLLGGLGLALRGSAALAVVGIFAGVVLYVVVRLRGSDRADFLEGVFVMACLLGGFGALLGYLVGHAGAGAYVGLSLAAWLGVTAARPADASTRPDSPEPPRPLSAPRRMTRVRPTSPVRRVERSRVGS